jgi:hypothetical protein
MWVLSADDLLLGDDPELAPWIPLTNFSEPPEQVLEKCRDLIDRKARCKSVPLAVREELQMIRDEDRLNERMTAAAICPSLEAFREQPEEPVGS